jgi:hypothetical protein
VNARLDKPDKWECSAESGRPLLVRVLCGKPNERGQQTCRGVIGFTSSLPLEDLHRSPVGQRLRWISRGEPSSAPYVLFDAEWEERAGTWTLRQQARSSRKVVGRASQRRLRLVREFQAGAVGGGYDIGTRAAKAGAYARTFSVEEQRSRARTWSHLPARALCPECSEPQSVTVDVLIEQGLGPYIEAGLLHSA